VADRPHFGAHQLETWRLRSQRGGKEESEVSEAVTPQRMASRPCGGHPAVHLYIIASSKVVEPTLGLYVNPPS
jgi:hypothetical protein